MIKDMIKNIVNSGYIDKFFVDNVEKKYGQIPDIVRKIISYNDNDRFIEKWRVISKPEILESIETIHVDFVKIKLLPVIDVGDNDFICYDLKNNIWVMFNIVDEIDFNPKDSIYDYVVD
ncbi:MAG: hypothetical protein K6F77_06855 [Lachnospiraceae bacterium]|nr:hypothetical protein [Lachnospiraceae bacterium]